MMEIKSDKEAFMAAMTLALCSNTEKECDHYLQYAVKYSQSLSELEIDQCKAIVMAEIELAINKS